MGTNVVGAVLTVRLSQTTRALLVFALCLTAYLSNCRSVPLRAGADTIPNRLIPFSILITQRPTLDVFRRDFAAHGGIPWYLRERNGRLVSFYPVGTALAALPFYVPVYAFLSAGGRPDTSLLFAISEQTEKFAASAMTALAVLIFWMTIRRKWPPRQAFYAALAFGLGTSMWATASQMLWQHTAVAASLLVALWLLTWPGFPRWAAAGAGVALSMAVAARPTAGVFFLAGLAATLIVARERRLGHGIAFCVAALPLIALSVGVNEHYFGHPAGGYHIIIGSIAQNVLSSKSINGIVGLLLSPNRGLLIFTPIALVGILGLARQLVSRDGRDPILLAFGAAAFVHLVIVASFRNWVGGWSFGPRYLVDILPILALAAVDLWPRMPRWARHLALVALAWSVMVQVNGAFCYPASHWNIRVLSVSDPEAAAWNWRELELWQDFVYWRWGRMWSAPY